MHQKDPKPLPDFSQQDIARFWSNVDKTPGYGPKGDCWKWTGETQTRGYGSFRVCRNYSRRNLRASRVAYYLQTGKDPWPLFVCHTCDWPPCCNGSHLFTGTQLDNMRDKMRKNRYVRPSTYRKDRKQRAIETVLRGEQVGTSILNPDKVREARRLRAKGWLQKDVAKLLGVSKSTIRDIDTGKSWVHIR